MNKFKGPFRLSCSASCNSLEIARKIKRTQEMIRSDAQARSLHFSCYFERKRVASCKPHWQLTPERALSGFFSYYPSNCDKICSFRFNFAIFPPTHVIFVIFDWQFVFIFPISMSLQKCRKPFPMSIWGCQIFIEFSKFFL